MKFGLLNVLALVSVIPLAVALNACSDDSSTSSPATKLPTEVKDLKELEEHKCDMSVIGEKVFVESEDLLYECDGDAWFKSYDQTKPSSTKSSGSKDTDGSSDSRATDKDGSSSDATTSSSSAKSSSSRPTEILEPEITVNETCTEVGACDAMVKTDISTWHFVRKDDFGDDAEYTYTADGKDLIVTIKNADGTTNSKTYSMYNMESEADVEMAFNAAKSTCKNGGGNDNKVKNCVKDTVIKALPECNASLEGVIGVDTTGIKVICRENEWQIYVEHGSLTDDRDGQTYKTVTIGAQTWMAQNLNYETENSWCYKDDPANCAKYGRLYTWAAAVGRSEDECGYGHECGLPSGDVRGICPSGWHLPSYSEWGTLFTAVGGSSKAGTKLKSLTGWNSGNGTDTYSFAALPAGFRYGDGDFGYEGEDADFWSSTEYKYNSDDAYYMNMEYSGASASMGHLNKYNGYSVRCLKDSE